MFWPVTTFLEPNARDRPTLNEKCPFRQHVVRPRSISYGRFCRSKKSTTAVWILVKSGGAPMPTIV
jgi:hypothetical protein